MNEETKTIIHINKMCIESLSPECLEQWEQVKYWLISTRKDLDASLLKELP